MKNIIGTSLGVLPPGSSLKYASTPFLMLMDRNDMANQSRPTDISGKCPWCHECFGESKFLRGGAIRETSAVVGSLLRLLIRDLARSPAVCKPKKAASALMQILCSAVDAWFALLCVVVELAQRMCYIHIMLNWRQLGYAGDGLPNTACHLCADTEYAGYPSNKACARVHLAIRGRFTNFPIQPQSKRQDCASHHAPETELVAADGAIMRTDMPALDHWGVLCPGHCPWVFHEDNETMIRVCCAGKSPTMRNLLRFHTVSVAYFHLLFYRPEYHLQYE